MVVILFDGRNGAYLEAHEYGTPPNLAYLCQVIGASKGVPPEEIVIHKSEDASLLLSAHRLKPVIEDGQVIAVEPDPAWQPPAPPPDPMAELAAKVDRLPAGTIHETRMRDQKEFMKAFAIPWVKANPQATPEDAALAILAALWAEFPADPICIQVYEKDPATGREDGLLMSYAESAHAAGLTPDKSWQALRGLILQAPEQQLREALRKL